MRLLLCAEVGSEESSTIKDKQDEYDVEMVCKMIQTLGPVLDKMKGKNLQAFGQVWELYLDTLSTISKDKSYSSRTRFTVEELFERRANKWEERRKEGMGGWQAKGGGSSLGGSRGGVSSTRIGAPQ